MRRTNEFQWNATDASLHHQPPQQFVHGTRQVSFAPVIPPIPLFDNGSQPQRNSRQGCHFPNPSYSSWDILYPADLSPSPWGTQDFQPMPTESGSQSSFLHTYESSLPSQPRIESDTAAYCPPNAGCSLIQNTTAISTDSLRLSSCSKDIEAVSISKTSTKRKRGKLSPVRKAKAKAQRKMGNCVRCRIMKSDVSPTPLSHEHVACGK